MILLSSISGRVNPYTFTIVQLRNQKHNIVPVHLFFTTIFDNMMLVFDGKVYLNAFREVKKIQAI